MFPTFLSASFLWSSLTFISKSTALNCTVGNPESSPFFLFFFFFSGAHVLLCGCTSVTSMGCCLLLTMSIPSCGCSLPALNKWEMLPLTMHPSKAPQTEAHVSGSLLLQTWGLQKVITGTKTLQLKCQVHILMFPVICHPSPCVGSFSWSCAPVCSSLQLRARSPLSFFPRSSWQFLFPLSPRPLS